MRAPATALLCPFLFATMAWAAPDAGAPAPDAGAQDSAVPAPAAWCVDGVEALTETVCHFVPQRPQGTLVIFLHGVIKEGTTWQYAQQLALKRFATQNGFEVIMPRGRLGAGSARFADHWNWPTSVSGQKQYESAVIDEWMQAKDALEKKNGKAFERVYVFGFSAGAYYAASLMLRGRLKVQGFAVFAGGGAPKHVERWAKGVQPKVPVYVGWGEKDRAKKDPKGLAQALAKMKWKHRAKGRRGVGHSMTDAQVREAVKFLNEATGGG